MLLRVPASAPADDVVVRYVHDGEPRYAVAEKDRETATRDVVARDLPRGQPDDAVPLAALGRLATGTPGSTGRACSRST